MRATKNALGAANTESAEGQKEPTTAILPPTDDGVKSAFVEPQEIAERLGVSQTTVKRWLRGGLVPNALCIGRRHRIPRPDFERMLREGWHGAATTPALTEITLRPGRYVLKINGLPVTLDIVSVRTDK